MKRIKSKEETWIEGSLWGLAIGFIVTFAFDIILGLDLPFWLLSIVSILIAVAFFIAGIREVPARHAAVTTFLNEEDDIVGPGYVWLWPKPIGDFMSDGIVSTARQEKEIVIGKADVSNTDGHIYTRDNVPISIRVTVIYVIDNIWRWVVEYEEEPISVMEDAIERMVRWFAEKIDAEDLVKLNAIIANVLSGNVEDDKISYEKVIMGEDERTRLPITTTIQEELPVPQMFKEHNLRTALERVGAKLEQVMVTSITAPRDVVEKWLERAIERAEREAEFADTQTSINLINMLTQAGITKEQAINMLETARGRGNRQIITIEGLPLALIENLLSGKKK